ncbi:MAG: hypothetical protein QOF55_657 [Thermoleophilaceae bacterium]|jgi:uncharacterized membrane protein|nr:hypothetical protein [Thermoleophilaceae bacterium]MEA2459130.1 hypothetical protein [Thermoleophilaceae bacterium]
MGKRSRKRGVPERGGGDGGTTASATTRAERDAARRRRADALQRGGGSSKPARRRAAGKSAIEDRPPPPWGKFPLVEIVVLIALVLLVASFFVGPSRRGPTLLGGLALGSLAGLELSIREHYGGFRSHSSLLAGFAAAVAITITYFLAKGTSAGILMVPIGGIVFAVAFLFFRRAFARRSGGVGFRR